MKFLIGDFWLLIDVTTAPVAGCAITSSVHVSFVPQRLHRIDFHGTARREIAGE
jgi:hypothetical protein